MEKIGNGSIELNEQAGIITQLVETSQGFFNQLYCVQYPHAVPFLRNELLYSQLKI